MKGFLLASDRTNSGKTCLALGLIRALTRRGYDISPFKVGPDYLDTALHSYAAGKASYNLDMWAMSRQTIANLVLNTEQKFCLIEGMMGLFDAALDGTASTADLAAFLGLPVILVVNCEKQSHSLAALIYGFQNFRQNVSVTGVILNQVKNERQARYLCAALAELKITIIGIIYKDEALRLDSRYLGVKAAAEQRDFEVFLDNLSAIVESQLNLDALIALAAQSSVSCFKNEFGGVPPLGQHIAVAKDEAFRFFYPHLGYFWQKAGAKLSFFSPLADEEPDKEADCIFLPGGYPELFAGSLSEKANFRKAMHQAVLEQKLIYGECGGYMVLGQYLEDKKGKTHKMLGLLPHSTSIKTPKLHLGYRKAISQLLWPGKTLFMHEFHYSQTIGYHSNGTPYQALFQAKNALSEDLGLMGSCIGRVMGSYLHIIDAQ